MKLDGRKTRGTRTETLVERVRLRILEDIIQARLKPGEMLQLAALADRYGVSRTPVREALTVLEREGLVFAIAYKGYLVRQIEPSDVHDIFFMRKLLEGAAIERATDRLDRETLDRLRGLRPPPTDVMTLAYDQYAHDFHLAIIGAANSPRLLFAFESVYNNVLRLQSAGIGSPRPDLIDQEHTEILDAMEAGDSARARALMEQHLDLVRARALGRWVGSV